MRDSPPQGQEIDQRDGHDYVHGTPPDSIQNNKKNIMMNVGRNLLPTHMYQIEEVALVIFVAVFNIMIRNR